MNAKEEMYLRKAVGRLAKWLPYSCDELMAYYSASENRLGEDPWSVEEADGLVYCMYRVPEKLPGDTMPGDDARLARIIVLVYDGDEIIADLSALHMSMENCLYDADVYEAVSTESDWMYLEHYTLCGLMFPEVPYPGMDAQREPVYGEALLFAGSYVTKAYRRRGIFTRMYAMAHDQVLRSERGTTALYMVFTLDPDIASFGPDAVKEPYVYSFEKDEPDRMRNREILAKFGFHSVRLEETEVNENSDGTKLWFAAAKERIMIVEDEHE